MPSGSLAARPALHRRSALFASAKRSNCGRGGGQGFGPNGTGVRASSGAEDRYRARSGEVRSRRADAEDSYRRSRPSCAGCSRDPGQSHDDGPDREAEAERSVDRAPVRWSVESPPVTPGGVSLKDKQQTTKLLLRSGATIQEMNAVRKHLSRVKGGQLAAATPARVASVILSDVIGNDLGTIGSGPTAPDPTTFREAWTILERYGVSTRIPMSVRRRMEAGLNNSVAETPKAGDALFRRVQNVLIGDNQAAVDAVARCAKEQGLHTLVLSTTVTGEAREIAKLFGAMAREIVAHGRPSRRPCCLVAGGETTVTIRGQGQGGRAQEFALAAALEIAGLPKVWVAGFATDGTDGPTPVAGAVVNGETVARADAVSWICSARFRTNDAYPVLQETQRPYRDRTHRDQRERSLPPPRALGTISVHDA